MKKYRKLLSLLLVVALTITTFSVITPTQAKKKAKAKVSSVKFKNAKKKLALKKGQTFKLKTTVKVSPNKAKNKKLKFKTSNKKVVTVSSKGVLKAKNNGTAKITATSKINKKKKAVVTVTVSDKAQNSTPDTPGAVQTSSAPSAAPSQTPGGSNQGDTSSLTPPATNSPAPTDQAGTTNKPIEPIHTNTPVPVQTSSARPTPTTVPTLTPASEPPKTSNSPEDLTPPDFALVNAIQGATTSNTSANTSAKVDGTKAITSFTAAKQYEQANYKIATPFSLESIDSVEFTLTVTGTPDSVSFKLLDTNGQEIKTAAGGGVTQYNKATGTHKITLPEEVKSMTIGGFAIMTNTGIENTTQTATATLENLKFVKSSSATTKPGASTSPTVTPTRIPSGPTPVPDDSKTDRVITLKASEMSASSGLNGNPVYNEDGSVTIKVTQESGGGGIAFFMDPSHQNIDLSNYTKISFRITADAEAPACFNAYSGSGWWSGTDNKVTALGYDSFPNGEKVYNFNLSGLSSATAFGLKYNTYGKEPSEIPSEISITIHSITLVRDTRDISVSTSNYSKLYELASQYGFKMGTVISNRTVTDSKYRDLMKYHFNSITAANEMKAYSMLNEKASKEAYSDENSMPVVKFEDANKIMDYAKENGMRVRGHVLVWDAGMKDWFFRVGYDSKNDYASADVVRKRLKNYMTQVIQHFEEKYPGIIYCWDVVNESVGDTDKEYAAGDARHVRTMRSGAENLFYKIMGDHYVEESFLYAREIIEDLRKTKPDLDIKLYYNDYNTFYRDKRDAICELVKSINSYQSDDNGGYVKLCDGVGMQSYIGGYGTQEGCMEPSHINSVKTAIEKFAALGCDVQVTELAVRNYQNDEETLQKHAEFYKNLFQVYMDVNKGDKKPLTAVCIWGIIDDPDMDKSDYSYTMNGTYCGLFDKNLGAKPAFVGIHDLMKTSGAN